MAKKYRLFALALLLSSLRIPPKAAPVNECTFTATATGISDTEATIQFQGNYKVGSNGLTVICTPYGVNAPTLQKKVRVAMPVSMGNLKPNTRYGFIAYATCPNGMTSVSSKGFFTTTGTTLPCQAVLNLVVIAPDKDNVTVKWTNSGLDLSFSPVVHTQICVRPRAPERGAFPAPICFERTQRGVPQQRFTGLRAGIPYEATVSLRCSSGQIMQATKTFQCNY